VAALFTAYAIEKIPPIQWGRLLLAQVRSSPPHTLTPPRVVVRACVRAVELKTTTIRSSRGPTGIWSSRGGTGPSTRPTSSSSKTTGSLACAELFWFLLFILFFLLDHQSHGVLPFGRNDPGGPICICGRSTTARPSPPSPKSGVQPSATPTTAILPGPAGAAPPVPLAPHTRPPQNRFGRVFVSCG
jgi:hypothetical protein